MTARTLGALLGEQAMNRAEELAVVDVGRSWTYGQASHDAGRIARALVDHGVEPGQRVGVHLHKSGEGFVAMHGVVRAGAIAVPLDPLSPVSRLARICEQMQIDVVVSHQPRIDTLRDLARLRRLRALIGPSGPVDGVSQVVPDDLSSLLPLAPSPAAADDPSYIITTSGSTGEPKGIVHTHRSALAYADMSNATYGLRPDDRVTDIAPYHFDISTHSLWAVPAAGATNIVIPEPYQLMPASHSQRLQDESVTFWYSVPFLLRQLVLRGDLVNRDLSKLRWVHFGGEVVPAHVIADFMVAAPNARFANIFGPAETNQCALQVFDAPPDLDRALPIGTPLAHTDLRIIDPGADGPDRSNVMDHGEAWVASPQLMEGYWEQPDLNARVLVESDGKRWYRTGDIVSVAEDGVMTFHGRVDHQVKVRGYRIELEAVELELEQLVGVDNVVAAVRRTPTGEDEIVVGLLNPGHGFDSAEFLASARHRLPVYAVPTQTVTLDEPVFTGSGKLDRRLLRGQVLARVESST